MTRFKLALCSLSLLLAGVIASPGFAQDSKSTPNVVADPVDSDAQQPSDAPGAETTTHGRLNAELNLYLPANHANDEEMRPASRRAQSISANRRARIVTRHTQEVVYDPIPAEEIEEATKFKDAIQALKDAKELPEKENAAQTIKELLERQFQRDVKRREDELAPVEQRVKVLRQQLDKRKDAMNDIISLRLKTILTNAEGLGFPDEDGLFDASASEFASGHAPGDKRSTSTSNVRPRGRSSSAKPTMTDDFQKPEPKPRSPKK